MERAGKLISKLKLPTGSITPQDLALAGWTGAVGKRIANHTRALSLVTDRLVVEVEDLIWQRQLAVLNLKATPSQEPRRGPTTRP